MRSIHYPLALVSCNTPTGPAGMLVSSFNTITLYPEPYISFNIKLPSKTYDAIDSTGRFNVNALNIHGVWLAASFLAWKIGKDERWPNVRKKETLMDHLGVKFTLVCEWMKEKTVEVGDHVVVIGKVVDLVEGKGKDWGGGLIYGEGKYRRAGKVVDLKGNRPGSGRSV